MARLFISHSSRDNVYALAFQNWLAANGWDRDDVFIDLHDIGAGERWRERLRRANAACEAVILLASPDSMGSIECQKELELAEALGKEIILAILRDLKTDDPLLARYSDRQFVDLSSFPQDHIEALTWKGQEYRIAFNVEALSKIKMRLDELGIAPGSFSWPPKGVAQPKPYPGLSAFEEEDAGIFFGRDADIMAALTEIRLMRRRRSPRLIVIDAASGAGKSSFLRAGLWPRLKRAPEFATLALLRPARGIISGPDGFGRRIAPFFERLGDARAPGSIRVSLLQDDEDKAGSAFASLIADAVTLAATLRQATKPDAKAPAALIAIDQAEELFQAEDDAESRRFLAILAKLLNAPPQGIDPYVILAIRADSAQSLLTRAAELHLETPKAIYLAPLSQADYREVIVRPAELYAKRVKGLKMEPALADRLIADATGADALPLLAFTLEQMFDDFNTDGDLNLKRYEERGAISGSIRRALRQAQVRAGGAGSDIHLRRLMLPRLATWDPEAAGGKGAAKRLVASFDDVAEGARQEFAPLATALVEARLLTRGHETIEVAHEALLRQPPISNWLAEDREFLIWRDRTSKARAAFEANARGPLVGRELQIARVWMETRLDGKDIPDCDRAFIDMSAAEEDQRRKEKEKNDLELALMREKTAKAAGDKAAIEKKAAEEMAAASQRVAKRTLLGLAAVFLFAVTAVWFGLEARSQWATAERERAAATQQKAIAEQQKAVAERQKRETEQQRSLAQAKSKESAERLAKFAETDARLLATQAQAQLKAGFPLEAIFLARSGLPDPRSSDIEWDARRKVPEIRDVYSSAVAHLTERTVLVGHQQAVVGTAFSPDGRRTVTASADETARLWDAETGQPIGEPLKGHEGAVNSAAFSPDGRRIVTASADNHAGLGRGDGPPVGEPLRGHKGAVKSAAFSPDGRRIVTASGDKTGGLWDAADRQAARRAAAPSGSRIQRRLQPGRAPHRHRVSG